MNKYTKIRLAVLICFVILFICLNHIINWAVVKYDNLNNMVEINKDNLSDFKKDKVYYWIEELDVYGNIAKYLNFRGWALAETEEDSSNRKVELILFNKEKQYAISTTLHERETYRAFPGKKIDGKKHGFYGKSSLINLRDGLYDIYINDVENDKNYGLVYTRRYIEKYGQNICISELDKLNTCINTLNTVNSSDIKFDIERIYIDDNYLNISGWAYLNDIQDNVRVLVGIKDNSTDREEFYTASRTVRNGIKKSFENNKANPNKGFSVKIPISDDKRYKISSIVIADKGKYYKTGFKEIDTIKYQQQINLNSVQNENAINLYIEKNKKEGNELFIAGWAYLNNINKTGKIYAGLKDNTGNEIYYTLEQIERNDVIKQYDNNTDLLNSGFYGFIDLQGTYRLSSIIIEYKDKYYRKEIGKQETKVESVNKKNYSTISNINKQHIINSNNIFMYIEDNQKNNNQFSILGWAYIKDINKTGKVYIGIKDNAGKEIYYTTEQKKREDVVNYFNNTDLLNSGFKANIKIDNIDNLQLSSIIIEYKGKYYRQEIGKQQTENENYSSIFNVDEKQIINSDNVFMYIEDNKQNNKQFSVLGWAYLTDINKTGKTYVGIKDKAGKEIYYTSEQIERNDVVKHFNNADLLNSGFKANIKLEDNEEHALSSIVIEYDNKYYKRSLNEQQIVELEKEKIIEGNALDLYVEKNEQHNNALSIEGWAYIKDIKKTGPIYIGVKDKTGKETYYITEQTERPDLVKHFNNTDLLNSGFKANIELENNEEHTLSSIVIEYDNKYYKRSLNKQQIVELEKNKIIEGTALDLYVEKNEQHNNALFIAGWAYIKDIKKIGPIYIGIKDKAGKETYYVTEQTERPDVVKHFNNADLLKSGFKVNIENNEALKLSSVIVEYENKYYKTNIE